MKNLPPNPNSQPLKLENKNKVIIRFIAGVLTGVIIPAVYWSDWFGSAQSLTTNILGCLTLAIICGFLTYKSGYKMIAILLSSIP